MFSISSEPDAQSGSGPQIRWGFPRAFTGRGQAEKAAKSAAAWAGKEKFKKGNSVGWVAGLRGRR